VLEIVVVADGVEISDGSEQVQADTGGIYTGVGGVTQKGTPLEVATQVMQHSRPVVGSRGEPPSSARRVPSLGEPKIAQAIDKAVHDALASKQIKSLAAGKMGMGTREVGDLIAKLVS
jgi:hypothetical protein